MNKKIYKKPSVKVIDLESTAILLPGSNGDEPNPRFEEIDIDDTPHTGPWG